jgi:hypothetical protein
MEQFKRSNVPLAKEVVRTKEQIEAYYEGLEEFAEEIKKVREESIRRSMRSQMSASKVILR